MIKTRSRLTTSLVPVAHVHTGATTALVPVARVMVNAWGVVTRFADAVKTAASALPVAKLASIAKPVKQAKGRQRQRISDSKIAAILATHGKHWNPAKAA
jgi:hypothetical protein